MRGHKFHKKMDVIGCAANAKSSSFKSNHRSN